ncbi:hypothetical protein FVE89_02810 [Methylobacterium sp. 2A]|nr:hypothetical protein [Methylobacterium sp. 2A]
MIVFRDDPHSTAPPPPFAGEGTLRSRGGEGRDDAGQGRVLHAGRASSGSRVPLSRPLLTQGPPSPAEGGGRRRITDPERSAPC